MVQVTTTLLQQVMECIPAKKDRFSNLQVLMDENEELPPSGFLSASIWFPSGPSDGFVFVRKIWFYLWKKNESQLRIPPCIRHLCWRVFLTDQMRPNQKDWYSFFCISRMYWNHFKTPLFCLHSCQQGKQPPKKSRSDRHLERYSSRPKLHAGPFFPFDWLHPGLLHPPSLGPRSKLLLLSRANWCFFTFYGI